MNKPKYLYHYTNIETLALILKNKNIRFSRLDNVDDLEEVETYDLGNVGRYCFISCWTADEQESIPFWSMYTKGMKGVRIKMPSDMFKTYEVLSKDNILTFKDEKFSKFKLEEIFKDNMLISPPWDDILVKVEYTNDESCIYPKIISTNYEDELPIKLNFGILGKYKRMHWSFQNEWRFKFNILPLGVSDVKNRDCNEFKKHLINKVNLDIDSYFLNIDENKFRQMEITMGPNSTEAEKIIVQSLIKEFNPTAKLYDSKLKNKVKPK